ACSPATTNDEVADAEIVTLGTPLATNNTCATASPQSYPTCGSQYATYYDTWYTFNSGNSGNINITITPEPGVTVGFAIYSGDENNLRDRKSTRLNSSHVKISYAVFCLKKKKINYEQGAVADDASALDAAAGKAGGRVPRPLAGCYPCLDSETASTAHPPARQQRQHRPH